MDCVVQRTAAMLACGFLLVMVGCSKEASSSAVVKRDAATRLHNSADQASPSRYGRYDPKTSASDPLPVPTPPKPEVPKVVLTESHAALCTVGVGDSMPEIGLPDLKGNHRELTSLYGDALTVICFWKGNRTMARGQLADLDEEVLVPYSSRGVNVVGIAVEESPESAESHLSGSGSTFLHLLDADGNAFAMVGSEKLPRTYLVDADGKILWFDIEYSRSTRRELNQAIRIALDEKEGM